ncbi:MAG TPA: hypothetical protein VFT76_00155 [Actinomycetota bacterium]|nr:hypothetical protein [Actinomycetota bacterium]
MTGGLEIRAESDGEGRGDGPEGRSTRERFLVVGEAPGRSGGPVLERAERKLPGITRLPRTNLLPTYPGPAPRKGALFPIVEAREVARLLDESLPVEVSFILMGRRVAKAFGFRSFEYDLLDWFVPRPGGRAFAVFPHPSGIVLWWNEPENAARARAFLREVLDSADLEE